MKQERHQRLDAGEVKARAEGRWPEIMVSLAPALAEAIERNGRHVPCPVHGGTDGFRVMKRFRAVGSTVCNTCGVFPDGLATLQWALSMSFREALEAVAGSLGMTDSNGAKRLPPARPVQPQVQVNEKQHNEDVRRRLRWVYSSSVPIGSPEARPAQLYLRNRGLTLFPKMLRMHPGLRYFDKKASADAGKSIHLGPFPTLITPVVDGEGRGVCLHRTYLTPDGCKAPVGDPKKLSAHPTDVDLSGCAARLFRYTDVLGVAEGVETAIAVTEATGVPCWALISSTLMPRFVPPRDVRRVIVFADKDRPTPLYPDGAGQTKARELIQRLWELGVQASMAVPPSQLVEPAKSVDWLDEFVQHGRSAFEEIAASR